VLAQLYAEQAERVEPDNRAQYLQAAANEIELASQGSMPKPDLLTMAEKIYGELSENAYARGDDASAKSYLQRLEVIRRPRLNGVLHPAQ